MGPYAKQRMAPLFCAYPLYKPYNNMYNLPIVFKKREEIG